MMSREEVALQLTLAVLEKEDDRVLSKDGDRSPKKVGNSVAELFNVIFHGIDISKEKQ